jgi:hypothetical protein
MQGKFIEAVERPSGRNVLAYISKHHVGPDIEIELFLLTPDRTSDERAPVVPEPPTRSNLAGWEQGWTAHHFRSGRTMARVGDILSGAACGTVGAMAMTGMRVITTELGLVEQTPPQAVSRQRARGMRALLRRARASSVAG